MAAVAAMASASSLASQQFSGLHRLFSISPPSSSPRSLFSESAQSQTRLSSSQRAPRGVVAMATSGKFFVGGNWKCNSTKKSSSKLVFDLNDAKLENDMGIHGGFSSSLKLNEQTSCCSASRYDAVIEAKRGNPPVMPAVMTPAGPLDLSSVLFRNRIIFIGQPVNSQVAQRVISQLVTLATIDEDADILDVSKPNTKVAAFRTADVEFYLELLGLLVPSLLIHMYLNCPGGSTYSVLAIYDCMSWIKPKVGTVCFGVAASQGALLLAGGEQGMRYAMPNARVMIHQPQSGCGGHVEDVRRQVNEAVQTRHKVDKMYAAFTGQSLEKVQQYTERDRFLSSAEALEFGLIDGLLETEY